MEYKGIIITGTNAAGKSTIALKICKKFKEFQIVQAVMIRKPREEDGGGHFVFFFLLHPKRGKVGIFCGHDEIVVAALAAGAN